MTQDDQMPAVPHRRPRVRRQSFRHSYDFVVVAPIRLTASQTLLPGEPLAKGEFRRYHLRSLYSRRRIAVAGSEYAEEMLLVWKSKGGDVVGEPTTRPEVDPTKVPEGVEVKDCGDGYEVFATADPLEGVKVPTLPEAYEAAGRYGALSEGDSDPSEDPEGDSDPSEDPEDKPGPEATTKASGKRRRRKK